MNDTHSDEQTGNMFLPAGNDEFRELFERAQREFDALIGGLLSRYACAECGEPGSRLVDLYDPYAPDDTPPTETRWYCTPCYLAGGWEPAYPELS